MSILSFKHYIEPWLLPPGLNLFFIFLGMLIGCYHRFLGRTLLAFGILSLYLLTTPWAAYYIVDILQDQYPILNEKTIKAPGAHAAIVVLGGGNTIEAEYGYQEALSDFTLHRVNYAAYLQQKMHLPIIVSGGKTKGSMQSEASLMAKQLQQQFSIKVNFIEDKSMTTVEESKYILPILKKQHLDKIILVTNAWHMPRSVYIFQCAGINVVPAPMGHYVYGPGYSLISFFPNMAALAASSVALHEYIGLLWYHVYYGRHCVK